MFILHSSNKTENLVGHLTHVIKSMPLSSPFNKEVFLIQSQGMERWLSQQLAGSLKVWANYEFLFPSRFFSSLAQRIDSRLNDAAFDRNLMLWRIEALLRNIDSAEFLPIKNYLASDNQDLKRYQLAKQLAQIFDQYQMMRPDMLSLWQKGELLYNNATERWQRVLWLAICEQTGDKHRGALWLETIAKFNNIQSGALSAALPERISVFGINTMPPIFLSYLESLAKHCDVHFFLLNPCESYWDDLVSKRQSLQDEAFVGHPLLSALGQQGREFQSLLHEQINPDFEPESFEASDQYGQTTVLQQLQNDILSNQLDEQVEIRPLVADNSISVHACHSRLREVEVLKNQLLVALENDASLELRDIVVMAADIEVYEPFISAVFSDIQHAIADRSLRLSNNTLDAFIRFLALSQSRLGWQSVLDLLEQPVIYSNFDLSETDLELIRYWIEETHVRWGQSAQHKKELGLPELNENTWQAALDRLLMGYAVGSDEDFVCDVLPFLDIEGTSAQALGGLCSFMNVLFKAKNELKHPKTLIDWSRQLSYYAEQLLGQTASIEQQQLHELLTALSADLDEVHNDTLTLPIITSWLEDRVSESKSTQGFLRGQLTFCSMLPMRSIPFKVIALLGMNEGEFPKIDQSPTFDLLSLKQHFRKGDRSRRTDDRYQFLEILLSTRQQLIMTYIGQSIANNETIFPSVVISELLEVLQNSYQLHDLTIREPLQSFSYRYFNNSLGLVSFSTADLQTAKALQAPEIIATDWWQGELTIEKNTVIELADLLAFYQHPQRHFMRQQLTLRFQGVGAQIEECEPFVIDRMEGYSIYHDWIEQRLLGENLSVKKLQAQGRWLSGVLGELEFAKQQVSIEDFVTRIQEKNIGAPIEDAVIDIRVNQYRLLGKLGSRYERASLIYRYSDFKGKDFINALLQHCVLNQLAPQSTYLLSTDEDIVLLPEQASADLLAALIDIYCAGQQAPNAFFVEAALAYIKQAWILKTSSRAKKPAIEVAKEWLDRAITQEYEPELKRLYQDMVNRGEILDEHFEQQCQGLLQPIWDAVH